LVASDAAAVRAHLETLAGFPDHWPAISLSNHDVIRTVSRFGPGSAKVMLALLCALRGTILLYQGEELGLPEVTLRRDQLKDPVGDLYYPLFKGRDGCRTPMPWDTEMPNLGFSAGSPWLPLGGNHAALAVSEQERDTNSCLQYLRVLLRARTARSQLRQGDLQLLDAPLPLIAFVRGGDILCVFNLGAQEIAWAAPKAKSLGCGTGQVTEEDGGHLVLGPFSAWFGAI